MSTKGWVVGTEVDNHLWLVLSYAGSCWESSALLTLHISLIQALFMEKIKQEINYTDCICAMMYSEGDPLSRLVSPGKQLLVVEISREHTSLGSSISLFSMEQLDVIFP